jgi:hypothetical protein
MICINWSDHEDWYHDEDNRTVEEFLADRRREHRREHRKEHHEENWPHDLDL